MKARSANCKKKFADLDEIWKAEKAQAQGSAHLKEEIDKLKFQIEELTRKGDFNAVAELQYGKLPELEKHWNEAQAKEAKKGETQGSRACCAPKWAPKKLPKSWRAPPAFPCPN